MNHQPCPQCRAAGRDRSGDNLKTMPDGAYCFACGYYENSNTTGSTERDDISTNQYSYQSLPDRKLTQATCKRFGYVVDDEGNHIARYIRDGKDVAHHFRSPSKKFWWKGYSQSIPLFGQHLWQGGKHLRITEGEIDCLSVWQAMGGDWPVVSIPSGTSSAVEHLKANLEFVNQFETVTFVFDMDEPGQKAAKACAELLSPGKAKIAHLTWNDPNDYLKAGEGSELVRHIFGAKEFRPDGILHISEVPREVDEQTVWPYPWKFLTRKLLGRAPGDLTMLCSGTGMGKSSVVRELIDSDIQHGHKTGVLMLEESTKDTRDDLVGLRLNLPVRRIRASQAIQRLYPDDAPLVDLEMDEGAYTATVEELEASPLYLYNHFGSLDSTNLLARLDYMARGLGCTRIYLDHISIVISGMDSRDERKDLDILMTNLRSFVERTNVWLCCVSHLSTPDGKPFEEGGQISLRHLRGSRSLGQLSDEVVALERNQQAEEAEERNTTTVRVLKARRAGTTGVAGRLFYNHNTGRLEDISSPEATTKALLDV